MYIGTNLKMRFFRLVASILYFIFKVRNDFSKILFSKKLEFVLSDVKKILVIDFGGIGDVLLTTPALSALRQGCLGAHIAVLIRANGSQEVLKGSSDIDEIIVTNSILDISFRKTLKLVWELRKRDFDLVICFKGAVPLSVDREEALFSSLSGAPYRLGYNFVSDSRKRRINYNSLYNINPPLKSRRHAAEYNLELLHAMGINGKVGNLQIQISDKDEDYSIAFMRRHGVFKGNVIIGIHPGSGEQTWKRWGKEKFAELADKLIEKYAAKVIFFYGPNEIELIDEISCLIKRKPIVASNLTIKQTSAIIEKCDIFVSGDTGLMHMAVAMRKPRVIAIFGPTNPLWTAPYGKDHILIRKDLPCSPCYLNLLEPGQQIKCETLECLKSISIQEVLQKVDQLLCQME
jgi:lipopolysaccharide heptosyltransferase II